MDRLIVGPKCFAVSLCVMLASAAVCLFGAVPSFASEPVSWVEFSPTGHLTYGKDSLGNRVPDFSTAGYQKGAVAPPHVATIIHIGAPTGGDDTVPIQAALDEAARRPLNTDGFRGAVELGTGNFRIDGTLKLSASGVVLRGAGRDLTTLVVAGKPRTVVEVGGEGTWRRDGVVYKIADRYVPVGTNRIVLEDAGGLRVGDRVIVQRPMTQKWISTIGMDRIEPRAHGKTQQWKPGPGLLFDRTITAVAGRTVELDGALTNALSSDDEPVLWRYRFDGRIRNVGVERIAVRGTAFFEDQHYRTDTYRHSNFVAFDAVEDSWLREVSIVDFSVAMAFRRTSGRISATDFSAINLNSPRVRAPPPIVSIGGQQILVARCSIKGQNSSAWVTQSMASGPNVVLRCRAEGQRLSAGAHQRWATGLLFDNVALQGRMHIGNRGNFGTGHGWSGANSVIWNSEVESYLLEQPPTANNWAFGTSGKALSSAEPIGIIVSPGKRVVPDSLYEKQKSDRLIGGAGR